MPIVLVVDDSPVDQQLIGGLLKRDFDWIVEYADDGEMALQKIADIFPDIIVADLQMPNMNGIDLCKHACQEFPHVPVILTTGQGSESLAIQALKAGAASYVPKTALAESLSDTVEQILEYSRKNKSKEQLTAYTVNSRHQFKIDNNPRLIAPLLDFLQDSMNTLNIGDPTLIRHASVSLEEALNNAMYHGNLELDDKHARDARRAYRNGEVYEMVQVRQKEEPYKSRRIAVAIVLTKSKVKFVVRDQGNGFDVKANTDSNSDSAIAESNKRGLTLIQNFMSEVTFNEDGTELRMSLALK